MSLVPDQLQQPVELEQLPELFLHLPPAAHRLLGEPHPLDLWVREANDPRAAVARPVEVADPELLVHHDLLASAGEGARGRETHHPRPDDGDLHGRSRGVSRPRAPTRFRSTPMCSTSSSTTSPGSSQRSSPCSRMQPVPTVPEPSTSPGSSR